ncbi:MAG: hypothetical protein WCW44_00705 [archaeon]
MSNTYTGPVMYMIHAPKQEAPRYFSETDKKNWASNKKKILQGLEKAGIRGIPVVYEMPNEEAHVKALIRELKHPPRIIWAQPWDIYQPDAMKRLLESEKVLPTRIIGYGMYRNICLTIGLESMKRAFPKAEVIMLRGTSTIFRDNSEGQRKRCNEKLKKSGIKSAKKLSFKHFVR